MRQELVTSAVSFLNDPQVADATLAKRIEFLESKGLQRDEIEEALKLAGGPSTPASGSSFSSTTSSPPYSTPALPPPLSLPPPIPKRDWKDYFVMATVSAGVAYGIYEVTRRYVLPLIVPPTPPSLEADKQALEAEFARAEGLISQLQKDTEELKESELKRKEELSTVLTEAQAAIDTVKSQSQKSENDVKWIKTQVDSIKDTLPRALERHRDQQDKALLELQEELKSLKQLINNRIKSSAPSGPPPASAVPSFVPSSLNRKVPSASSVGGTSVPSLASVSAGSSAAPSGSRATPVPAASTPSPETSASSTPASSTPVSRPGIPAWQLAAASKSPEPEATTS